MKNYKYLFLFLFCLPIISSPKFSEARLAFHGGYTFETLKGQRAAAAYVSIFNPSDKDIYIKSISTDICESAEIHEIVLKEDIMKMQKVSSLKISAMGEVYLQPGNTHIMLMGLKKELVKGSSFKIIFESQNQGKFGVKILVLDSKLRENLLDRK